VNRFDLKENYIVERFYNSTKINSVQHVPLLTSRTKMVIHTMVAALTVQVTLMSISIFGSNTISKLAPLINEYAYCFNVIYIFAPDSTDYEPTLVPVYLISYNQNMEHYDFKAKEEYGKPKVTNITNLQRSYVTCVVGFLLFPERAKHFRYRFPLGGLESTGYNSPVTIHVFSTGLKGVLPYGELRFRHFLQMFHKLEHPKTRDKLMVSCSFLLLYRPLGSWNSKQNYEFSPFLLPENRTWRNLTESARSINKRNLFSNSPMVQWNISNYVNWRRLISQNIPSPFAGQLSYKFNVIIQLICWEMLDAWVEVELTDFVRLVNDYWYSHVPAIMLQSVGNIRNHLIQYFNVEAVVPTTGTDFLNFVTCDGVTTPIPFHLYTSPYDLSCWLVFGLLIFLILPLGLLLFERRSVPRDKLSFYRSMVRFFISTALEVSPALPAEYETKFTVKTKLNLGVWLVFVVTLTNAYKGIVVSQIMSPRPTKSIWTNVTDMDGFVFVLSFEALNQFELTMTTSPNALGPYERVFMNLRGCHCFQTNQEFVSEFCLKLTTPEGMFVGFHRGCGNVSLVLNSKNVLLPKAFNHYFCKHEKTLEPFIDAFHRGFDFKKLSLSTLPHSAREAYMDVCHPSNFMIMKVLHSSAPSLFPFTNGVILELNPGTMTAVYKQVLDFTSNCYKTAYVDYEGRLDAFLAYNRQSRRNGGQVYIKGQNRLLTFWKGLVVSKGSYDWGNRFSHALQRLLSSGIYAIWDKWYHKNNLSDEEKMIQKYEHGKHQNVGAKSLAIDSNISTAFYLYMYCTTTALLVFLGEARQYLYMVMAEFSGFVMQASVSMRTAICTKANNK